MHKIGVVALELAPTVDRLTVTTCEMSIRSWNSDCRCIQLTAHIAGYRPCFRIIGGLGSIFDNHRHRSLADASRTDRTAVNLGSRYSLTPGAEHDPKQPDML
jgi:hypothetical protein